MPLYLLLCPCICCYAPESVAMPCICCYAPVSSVAMPLYLHMYNIYNSALLKSHLCWLIPSFWGREYLSWLRVSEVPVHDQFAPFLKVCYQAGGHGGKSVWRSKAAHSGNRKTRVKLMEIPPVSDLRLPAGPPTKERQPLNNAMKPTDEIWDLVTKSLLQTPSASNQAFNMWIFREMFQIKTIGKARMQHNCVLHHLSMSKEMLCGQLVRVFQN